MSAISINIDSELGLVYNFKIGGKNRELTFTDQCASDMDKVNLKVAKTLDEISNLDTNKLNNESVKDQSKLMMKYFAEIRNAIIEFFDDYFGHSAGKEIYKYYHESTRALSFVFNKIYEKLNQVTINKPHAVPNKKA